METIYTAGAATALFTTGASTALAGGTAALAAAASGTLITASLISVAAIAGAAVGAAVGSVASQLTGKALGVTDKFSWSQVTVAGLTGAAGSVFGRAIGAGTFGSGAAEFMKSTPGFAVQGVFNYSANYAANKIVGLDTSFSWKNVAASAAGAMIAGNLNTRSDLNGSIMRGITSAASSAYIRDKWFGGSKPDYAQVAADAFGNVLADYLVGAIGKPADEPDSFFQIGSGEPMESFSYSGNRDNSSTIESPFYLDTSELGTYESSPDYSSGAYLADVDTDRYLAQMSTDTNPSNPYENLVDPQASGVYSSNSASQSIAATSASKAGTDDLISLQQLQAIIKPTYPYARTSNMELYLPILNLYLPQYDMTTPELIAAF